jgi:TDG/mug DNA glycosylase family protein
MARERSGRSRNPQASGKDGAVDRKMLAQQFRKPTRAEILAARNKRVPDLLGPRLKVLFVGINPGLYTAAIRRHFGRPGNRFWPALFAGGFTPRLFSPYESDKLLRSGYGITNLVNRATTRADELTPQELRRGARRLLAKVRKFRPRLVAMLGVQAYRQAFNRPQAGIGRQDELFGNAEFWVLPNPSGINAHYLAKDLARMFKALRTAVP